MTIPDFPAVLFTYGPLGIVLAWFMLRGETKMDRVVDRLDRLAHKIEGVTRAMLADVMSRQDADSRAKDIARNMLAELDAKRKDDRDIQPCVVTSSSDGRLKNIVGSFTRGLADVMKISPTLFTWKPESGIISSSTYAGFTAEDVRAAIPEAVGVDPAGHLSLSERPIVAALVNAVRELKQQNDALSARLEALAA